MDPKERAQVNSKGFTDFCVRNITLHKFGRREIQIAEEVRLLLNTKFQFSILIYVCEFLYMKLAACISEF